MCWLFVFLGPKRVTQTIEELCSGLGTMVGLSTEELDERVASLFQSDAVLPLQYLEAVCRKADLEAEQKLMLAVLEDAVTCFQQHFVARDKIGMSLFREAEEWILLQGKSDWFFLLITSVRPLAWTLATSVRDCCIGGTIGLENRTGFDLE